MYPSGLAHGRVAKLANRFLPVASRTSQREIHQKLPADFHRLEAVTPFDAMLELLADCNLVETIDLAECLRLCWSLPIPTGLHACCSGTSDQIDGADSADEEDGAGASENFAGEKANAP